MTELPDFTQLPVSSLLEWGPFKNHIWSEFKRPITLREVYECIKESDFESQPYDLARVSWRRRDHIRRVAYFVVNPPDEPIAIDVGVPSLGCYVNWPVTDGHHRLGAAIYRGDEFIQVDLSGDLGYASELFGLNIGERSG